MTVCSLCLHSYCRLRRNKKRGENIVRESERVSPSPHCFQTALMHRGIAAQSFQMNLFGAFVYHAREYWIILCRLIGAGLYTCRRKTTLAKCVWLTMHVKHKKRHFSEPATVIAWKKSITINYKCMPAIVFKVLSFILSTILAAMVCLIM